jgi:2,3-bisphosphoglycerate-independent phosphoglycerate mutase
MLKKVVILVIDGLGDRSIKELGNQTPLQAAVTENFDRLARQSECGMMHVLGRGARPGSDVAHLGIFGYAPEKYYSGRGPIEVAGLGIHLEHGDVALRGNLGTVDENLMITDRRAGRIRNVEPFTRLLDGLEIDGVTFIVKPGTGHRAGVIMRGSNLSSSIIDADPHEEGARVRTVTPTDDSPGARRTAEILNKFLAKAHDILQESDLNNERIKEDKPPANYLLVRGAGKYNNVPGIEERYGLKACCIAGGGLYKGVGAFLGMKVLQVPGATGLPDTDVKAKFNAALEQLNNYDFVFVHVKAVDSLGEDGNFEEKKHFIEKIDNALAIFDNLPEDTLLVVTADHSTSSILKAHSADPVPIMFYGNGVRVDQVSAFNEIACTSGGLGFMEGKDLMPHVLNLFGKLHLMGA